MLPKKLAFVDVETTGGSLKYDRIIEVGILLVENNRVIKKYQTLIDPQAHIPNEILKFTGILKDSLDKAPTFRKVSDEILEFFNDSIFVAHNARFDYGFLKSEFKRVGINFSSKPLCTLKLSRLLNPKLPHHNLDSIIQRYNISCKKRHRAFYDAEALVKFYKILQKEFPKELLIKTINSILKKPSLPSKISEEDILKLPESSGVYIFYDENSVPLYVGKSINIKNRVMSHFSSDHSSPIEMKISQNTHSIEVVKTRGELGALLKESKLIKTLQPLYNRKLRYCPKLVVLKKSQNESKFNTLVFEEVDKIAKEDLENILGIFKSKKQAKDFLIGLAKEYNLCDRLLKIESTNNTCFGYRLNRCYGACIGEEKYLSYNMRFDTAFFRSKIKNWPFRGAIVIEEKGEDENYDAFVIDKWCYLDETFDVDIYNILKRYILSTQNQKKIKIL